MRGVAVLIAVAVGAVAASWGGSATTRADGASAPPSGTPIRFGSVQTGRISQPGEVDRYRFEVASGTRVFLDAHRIGGVCGANKTFTWSLAPAGGRRAPVFRDRSLYIAGFCSWWGPVTLERGGTYVLTIRGQHGVNGPYAFVVWTPRVDDFRVQLRAYIRPGTPGRGAGRIEVPGAADRYRFHAPRGTRLFLDARSLGADCGRASVLRWSLYSEFTPTPLVNDALLYSLGMCYDQGPITLNGGGNYAVVVHGRADSVGPYAFRLVVVAR